MHERKDAIVFFFNMDIEEKENILVLLQINNNPTLLTFVKGSTVLSLDLSMALSNIFISRSRSAIFMNSFTVSKLK